MNLISWKLGIPTFILAGALVLIGVIVHIVHAKINYGPLRGLATDVAGGTVACPKCQRRVPRAAMGQKDALRRVAGGLPKVAAIQICYHQCYILRSLALRIEPVVGRRRRFE